MKKTKWISFGVQPTLDRSGKLSTVAATVSAPVPVHAKKFGLENVRNTPELNRFYGECLNFSQWSI